MYIRSCGALCMLHMLWPGVAHPMGSLRGLRGLRMQVPGMVDFMLRVLLPALSRDEDSCAELAGGYFKAIEAAISNHFKAHCALGPLPRIPGCGAS